jgi:hypothetical protein
MTETFFPTEDFTGFSLHLTGGAELAEGTAWPLNAVDFGQ